MNTRYFAGALAAATLALSACSDNPASSPPVGSPGPSAEKLDSVAVGATIAKWYNNHAGAITLTYDSGWPAVRTDNKVQMLARGYGAKVDFELVTANYRAIPELRDYLEHVIKPLGIGVFGHGDEHVGHDSMTYEQAYASFKRCYDTMLDFGLKPVAYAYPGGAGFEAETQKALADAGFLSGRSFHGGNALTPYITPDDVAEPPNWYDLPTLIMEEYHIAHCEECVGSAQELGSYVDETVKRKAWIIPTYHVIYDVGENQGYYRLSEFEKDLQEIKKRDVWCATFNEGTLYVRERAKAKVKAFRQIVGKDSADAKAIYINLTDNLPDELYSQPLTVLIDIPPAWVGKTLAVFDGTTFVQTVASSSERAKISLVPIDRDYRVVPLK